MASMTAKIDVFAPRPSASVMSMVTVHPGRRMS